jgi:predicted ATPase
MIRGCVTVAVDGTHAAGKTTLVHALVAYYRRRGVLVDCVGEPARTSPFIDDIVMRGSGDFDLVCEVDLFAAQLSAQLRAARHQRLLVCDKTVVNVLGYARQFLDPADDPRTCDVLAALAAFGRAWAATYDAVFYCADRYDQADPLRAKVAGLQNATDMAVRAAYDAAGIGLVELPVGLPVEDRVVWVAARVDALLGSGPG